MANWTRNQSALTGLLVASAVLLAGTYLIAITDDHWGGSGAILYNGVGVLAIVGIIAALLLTVRLRRS